MSTLLVRLTPGGPISRLFAAPELTGLEQTLHAGGGPAGDADVRGRLVTPDEALAEYLADHGLARITRRLMSTGAIEVVTTAAPGIRDLLVLGRVKAFEASQLADLIVLDAPAAGHAVAFLQSPTGLRGAAGAGPIATQADDVLEMLADPERCRVMLVTLAEETPVNEVIETAFALEEEIGVALGPVIVNGLVPVPEGLANDFDALVAANAPKISTADIANLRDAAAFRLKWAARQNEQVARLSEALPLAQLHTPYVFTTEPGPAELETLSNALSVDIDALSEDDT
jgi:hypothetical protein